VQFELIVFDWDGTLMDSEARIVGCLRRAFRELEQPVPPPEEARDVIGLGLDQAMRRLHPSADETLRGELIRRYRYHFLRADPSASPLFEGARETVAELHRRELLLAVATGKSRVGLEQALDDSGLRGYFHAQRCAEQTQSKPHPQMLLEILDELGVRAEDALMVGDTEYDMQMARNAGVPAVAVSYGVHEPERLLAHGPLACLDRISDLPDWLLAPAGS
jgi:phosphoglycolate phosphatase